MTRLQVWFMLVVIRRYESGNLETTHVPKHRAAEKVRSEREKERETKTDAIHTREQ